MDIVSATEELAESVKAIAENYVESNPALLPYKDIILLSVYTALLADFTAHMICAQTNFTPTDEECKEFFLYTNSILEESQKEHVDVYSYSEEQLANVFTFPERKDH